MMTNCTGVGSLSQVFFSPRVSIKDESKPENSYIFNLSSIVISSSDHRQKRILWTYDISLGYTNNPRKFPHLCVLNLITSAKSLWQYKVICHLQVSGFRVGHLASHYSAYLPQIYRRSELNLKLETLFEINIFSQSWLHTRITWRVQTSSTPDQLNQNHRRENLTSAFLKILKLPLMYCLGQELLV